MNKHFIILPVLLTSAVSLHVLSYNLEEPPEIVQNSPIPVTSPIQSGQPEIPVVSPSSDKVAVIPSQANKSPNIVVTNSPAVKSSAVTVPVVVPNTSTTTSVTTTVTSPVSPLPSAATNTNIQIASALIPTKNYGDMVREAKQVGGRVDPFLSMKPPEMEKLPELPTPSPNISFSMASKNSGNTKSNVLPNAYAHIPSNMKIPNPPRTFIPNDSPPVFVDLPSKGKNTKTTNTSKTQVASNTVTSNTTKSTTKTNTSTNIVFTPEAPKVERGLQLTGIITGNKPLALIKVDNESKVFGIGDIVRQDGKIKIVSINFENQAVTLSDNKNRKVKLEIKS